MPWSHVLCGLLPLEHRLPSLALGPYGSNITMVSNFLALETIHAVPIASPSPCLPLQVLTPMLLAGFPGLTA